MWYRFRQTNFKYSHGYFKVNFDTFWFGQSDGFGLNIGGNKGRINWLFSSCSCEIWRVPLINSPRQILQWLLSPSYG